MSRDERFEDVLRAFAADRLESIDPGELDRLYSQAVSEGLVDEIDLARSFEKFLNRVVTLRAPATVGAFVRDCRVHRNLTERQLADEMAVGVSELEAIEACEAAFDPERISSAALALSAVAPTLSHRVASRILQRLRVKRGIGGAEKSLLNAARKPKQGS